MVKALFIAVWVAFMIAVLAMAARAQAPPLSDNSIMMLRAEAAEAENKYMMAVINRVNDHDKDLADYWTAYVKGLDKKVDAP